MSWLSTAWAWYATGVAKDGGPPSFPHAGLVNPIVAGIGAMALIGAAIQQARIATRRHVAQSEADRQRRVTESFSKAVEQLGSDKIAVRLGGIYTLERISRESPDDYWNVMETLTAFIRERRRPDTEDDEHETVARFYESQRPLTEGPQTDVAAILTVLRRRPAESRTIEAERKWRLDLRGADLRAADLSNGHFENALMQHARLEAALLQEANFTGAEIQYGRFDGANLLEAIFERAYLHYAHFEKAAVIKTRLSNAWITEAHFTEAQFWQASFAGSFINNSSFEGTDLNDTDVTGALFGAARLAGAKLQGVTGLTREQLEETSAMARRLCRPGCRVPRTGRRFSRQCRRKTPDL